MRPRDPEKPREPHRGPQEPLVASDHISLDFIMKVIQFLVRFGDPPVGQKIAIEAQRGSREAQRAFKANCLHSFPNGEHSLYCTFVA